MGKVLLKIILILFCIAATITGIGYLLPREYSTSAEVTIEGPVDEVFRRVNTTEQWTNWSPWSPNRITDLRISYEGEPAGEGAIMVWKDPRPNGRFDGRMEITGSDKNKRIEIVSNSGEIPLNGFFEFEEVDGKTKVTWTAAGKLPVGASYGWFGLYYNSFLKNELNNSLIRLKEHVEGKKAE